MKSFLFIALLIISSASFGEAFQLDTKHSKIEFKIGYLAIASVTGVFNEFTGQFDFDTKNQNVKDLVVEIKATSIDTGIEARDEHLRTEDFFGTKKFPTIKFAVKTAEQKGNGKLILTGPLTIRDKTKTISFELKFTGKEEDPWGNELFGYTATSKINRKDFGVAWNKQNKKGTFIIGDEVDIVVEGIAKKKEEKQK